MPRKPASPSFLHISFGNAFELSVFAASDSGISRRVNSWTLSRSSVRSSVVGGTKLRGCVVDAERLWAKRRGLGRERWIWRRVFVRARETWEVDIMTLIQKVFCYIAKILTRC